MKEGERGEGEVHAVSAGARAARKRTGQLRRCKTHLSSPTARIPHPRTIAGSARLSTSTVGRATALPLSGRAMPIAPTSPRATRSRMLLSVTGPLWRCGGEREERERDAVERVQHGSEWSSS